MRAHRNVRVENHIKMVGRVVLKCLSLSRRAFAKKNWPDRVGQVGCESDHRCADEDTAKKSLWKQKRKVSSLDVIKRSLGWDSLLSSRSMCNLTYSKKSLKSQLFQRLRGHLHWRRRLNTKTITRLLYWATSLPSTPSFYFVGPLESTFCNILARINTKREGKRGKKGKVRAGGRKSKVQHAAFVSLCA